MSRLPTVGLSIGTPSPKVKRLSRQPSMDLRKRKTLDIPPPVPSSTVVKTRSRSLVEQRNKVELSQQSFCVGERVAVDSMGVVGTLKFLGEAEFKEGLWAGIQLDIPGTGKNDGSVKGVRYFSCPPQTGLFILASKLTPLDQDSDHSVRSLSPNKSGDQIKARRTSHPLHTPVASPVNSNRQSMRSQVQSPTPSHYRGIPSPAMTPTHPTADDDDIPSIPETAQDRLERMMGEAVAQAPNETVMKLQQLQLRVEVLEAENRYLKLENTQNKTAEHILERSLVLKGQELFTFEGHKAIVEEMEAKHAEKEKDWDQGREEAQRTMTELEAKVRALETEQTELISQRDLVSHEAAEAQKLKREMESQLSQLESKVAEAEAATRAAQTSEKQLVEKTMALQQQMTELKQKESANHQFFQPGEDTSARQMQLEMEMVEVHEKMNSLREAARAKDMFLTTLSEQVEVYRNAVEEKEREMRRIKAEAECHARERDRVREELNELETKWSAHQDCADKETFDKLKRDYNALKESQQTGTCDGRIRELQETIEELKRAGMESIELYESSVEVHRIELESLNANLADESRKVALLETERDGLRTAGHETIEAYESTIAEMKEERERLWQEQESKQKALQSTIDNLKEEINRLMTHSAVEDLKDVWEKERNRLTEQIMSHTESLEKEKYDKTHLKQEIEVLKDQLKASEALAQEKAQCEEQLKKLQKDYDEQLAARSKYLNDVCAAVEKQKKTEGELRRMTEQKETLERELQELSGSADTEGHLLEIEIFRKDIERLEREKEALIKQKDNAENSGQQGADNQQLIDSLKAENKELTEKYKLFEESHRQTELECLKLMEEVEKLHQVEQPSVIQLSGLNEDEKTKELFYILQDNQKKMDQLVINHKTELRKCKEKGEDDERDYKRTITGLNHDISELEGLIESKIFKEADLEEALENERKLVKKLQIELQDLKDDMFVNKKKEKTFTKVSEGSGPYCEICEIYGHDIISCKAVSIS